jgi:TPR repeat protein
MRLKQPVLAIWFAAMAIPVLGQSAGTQNPGIDAALLAKANAGDAAAQVLVGDSYAAGSGQARSSRQITADYKQAAEWYRKAAEKGYVSGEIHLADLYRDGRGMARDVEQAANWYRKAAEQGDAGAQGTLGLLYSIGQGVPQSDVEAYYWLDLAAAVKGPKQAQYIANRQMVGTRITADELSDVQDRVEKWLAEHPRRDAAQ